MTSMAMPEGPNVLVSRQAVLLATGVGVGLLTLVYVLGVQVCKQSAALHAGAQASSAELKELPAPLTEQLKTFEMEVAQREKARNEPPKAEEAKSEKTEGTAKTETKAEAPKIEAKKEAPKAESKKAEPKKAEEKLPKAPEKKIDPGEGWTQQLVTTTDAAEARRIAARANEAGYETVEVKTGDSIRVRVKGRMSKPDADAAGAKLKEKGLKPFAVKVE
jgi:outer membrane biosynthesis protein TonB